jgi:hypothetical protein
MNEEGNAGLKLLLEAKKKKSLSMAMQSILRHIVSITI